MRLTDRAGQPWLRWGRVAAAPLLLAFATWWADPTAVLHTLQQADARWLLAGLACSLAFNVLSALRWRHLVRWLGHEISTRWALAVNFRALALGSLLPGATVGGDLLRAWHLRRHGCTGPTAGLSVVLDRLSGWWMLWVLAAAGLVAGPSAPLQDALHWPKGTAWGLLGALLLLPLAAGALWHRRHQAGTGPWQAGAVQTAVALGAQTCSVASFACAARAFGIGLPWELIAITAAPIFLLASLPLSVGGWGTRELATATAWSALGVAAPQATVASLTFGAYALVQAVLGLMAVPQGAGASGAPATRRP